MPFTGRLGTPDSQPGNIELGASGSGGRTSQNLQLRARIQNTSMEGLQLQARIQTTSTEGLQLKANIKGGANLQLKAFIAGTATESLQLKAKILSTNPPISLKARIAPGLSLKGRIVGLVSSDLEIDYHVLGTVSSDLLVTYNATNATRVIQSLQMGAKVVPAVSAALSVSFDLCYALPGPPVLRPTQRTEFHTLRTLSMRARIQTCTVVLQDGVYKRVCG